MLRAPMTPPDLLFLLVTLLGGPAPIEEPLDTWSGRAGECAFAVATWDSEDQSEVTGRYGDSAEAFVESCRLFLDSVDD